MIIPYIPTPAPDRFNISPENCFLDFGHLLLQVLIILALIFLGLGWIVERIVTNMSPETEKKIVQWVPHSEFPKDISESPKGKRILPYLDELLARLSEAAEINCGLVKVHLLDNNEVNAVMLPTGEMGVYMALLNVQSENELAFVLAHELGHLKHRDYLKTFGRKLVFLVTSQALGISGDVSNWLTPVIIQESGEVTGLGYDRRQEYAADEEGLAAVVKYYGHGGHALDLFERLKEKEQPSEHSWLSDHPTLSERIAHLKQVAKNRGWRMEGEATRLPN